MVAEGLGDEEQRSQEAQAPDDAEPGRGSGSDLDDLAEDVAELRAIAEERDQLFERLQRVTAELENYRKRVRREREQWRQYALEDFLRDLLASMDNLNRAIQAARESGDLDNLLAGLELIDRELHQTIERYGVQPIEALGRPFDPFEHEAVEVTPAGDEEPGTVTAVPLRGYRLHDRVLRASRVRVAQSDEAQAPVTDGDEPRRGT